MSAIYEDKKKFPLELISNLLKKLLDSKLSRLETKSKDEMDNIKSISKNTEIIINDLKKINQKIKPKIKTVRKVINEYNPFNIRKNSIKVLSKLNTTITSRKTQRTPDRKYFPKIKTNKNNNIRKLKLNRSEIFSNNFLNNKSQTNSKILNCTKRVTKKSRSKKKNRDLTPGPSSPSSMFRKIKEKEKPKYDHNSRHVLKNNHTCSDFYNKYRNKSCKILPLLKKDKLNVSKLSKNDELDLLCATTDDDKRIYDLNPEKKINNKNVKKIKKIY